MIYQYHIDRGAERISIDEALLQASFIGKGQSAEMCDRGCLVARMLGRCRICIELSRNVERYQTKLPEDADVFAAAGAWLFHNGHGLFLLTNFVAMI